MQEYFDPIILIIVFSLFNSEGEWEAKILGISKNTIEFKIIKQLRQKEITKELWLAFSPIKSNYQNFMLQKATELGVTKFLPTFALAVFYLTAFYLLTFVVNKLPIAIVYATWSGLGIFTIAILGYIFFKQTLAWQAIVGLFLIVIGVVLVNSFTGKIS